MIPRKKTAVTTISLVILLRYFTCMKKRTTSVALVTAIASAIGKFSCAGKSMKAGATVSAVPAISAPKMAKYGDVDETCADITYPGKMRCELSTRYCRVKRTIKTIQTNS